MEELRTVPVGLLGSGASQRTAQGLNWSIGDPGYHYDLTWVVTPDIVQGTSNILLTIAWTERGDELHSLAFQTEVAQ